MSSSGGGSSRSSDGAAKHRKLVAAALASSSAVELLSKYHERGVDIFSALRPEGDEKSSIIAAILGHDDVIQLLHELGCDLNDADAEGCTPAYHAAMVGQVEAIRTLCELGANIISPENHGCTAVATPKLFVPSAS
jgi:ankyrin repeat protein